MNALNNADPKIQTAVAIGAVVTGVVAIVAISNALGRKWAKDQIKGIQAATAAFQNNRQK